eukprot:gb/GECH01010377.1/.p1 GENE.gb/GECH01010377.1/~~gb/GECH01010377.1/.p1  ORF type:complete len:566 (+),score=90.59 gb/GECH01010377.1/:1-1698(+)
MFAGTLHQPHVEPILERLRTRNAQGEYFREIINQYQRLYRIQASQRETVNKLTSELKSVRSEKADLESMKYNGTDGSGADAARLRELENKNYKLQEELTGMYRAKSELAEEMLQLSGELKETKRQLESSRTELRVVQDDLKQEREHNEHLQTKIENKDNAIDLLTQEKESLQTEVQHRDDKVEQLQQDNKTLLEQVMHAKSEYANRMNEINEMHEQVLRQKKEMEEMLSRYKNKIQAHGAGAAGTDAAGEGGEGMLELLGSGTTTPLTTVSGPEGMYRRQHAHQSEVNAVGFSCAGHRLVTGGADKEVKLWDARTTSPISTLRGTRQGVVRVGYSRDDTLVLAACNDACVYVWNARGQHRHTLTGHTDKIYGSCFSNDSSHIITGSHDRTIKLWETSRGSCIKTKICFSSCTDLDVNGNTCVSGHYDGCIRLWDGRSLKQTQDIPNVHVHAITSLSIAPDARYVLTNSRDNTLNIFDMRMQRTILTLNHSEYRTGFNHNKACWSPCGSYVAAGSKTSKVFVWDAASGEVHQELSGHEGSVAAVAWSPDGTSLASAGFDGYFILWQ